MPRTITTGEQRLMTHVTMFGSKGYPVHKLGRGWTWGCHDVPGPPKVFRTKREAVASFEAFWRVLVNAKAGRL